MPASRSAISSPMLLITVATTASPLRRPSALRPLAHISITASPSTIAPRRVHEDGAVAVAVERDAHLEAAADDHFGEALRDASSRSAG